MKVNAHSFIVIFSREVNQRIETLNLKEKVDSFRLLVMVDKLRDDLIDKPIDLFNRLLTLHTLLVVFADLASEAAQVLMTPTYKLLPRAQQAILQRFGLFFIL